MNVDSKLRRDLGASTGGNKPLEAGGELDGWRGVMDEEEGLGNGVGYS